ncbi:MAG: PASTA domain-containing protein [Clostridia bacterium]|nr:PASTA domain-containing protein [Clostridia bacterium]
MAVKASKMMIKRIIFIMLAVVILFVSVTSVRLVQIMIIDGEKMQSLASEQQLYDTLVTAPRGNIYDSEMNLIATSDTAYTVYITPNSINSLEEKKQVKVREAIAKGFSEILDMDYETAYGYTEKKTYYVIVKKRIDKPTADKIRTYLSDNSDLKLAKYVGIDETTKRYYPNQNLASVLLGFVGDDNQGLSGLENYYDRTLTGVAGRVVAAKNALGADMPFSYQVVEEAKQGNSLVLTVDSYIQHIAEKYLEQAVEANKASDRGACIVMNVNTGAVLAMAVKGDFNPNEPFTLTEEDKALLEAEDSKYTVNELLNKRWRNKAVSDTYEPGSVFKIMTASMVLEEDLTSLTNTYNCGYTIYVAGQIYHCHKRGGHGLQTFKQAMVNSCNPTFITVGQLLGVSKFSKYFEAFGLTKKTGIDLPGEASPVYHKQANMGPTELASSSFGQTFKVSAIQLITAASAAVNGGYLYQPYVVEKIIDSDNNVVKSVQANVKRQVISESTSTKLREMLKAVVNDGGASNAYVAGYGVGGKTGTSEKVAESQASGERLYIASFIGFAPIDDPEIAVLIMIDEPHGSSHFGGAVAAPVGAEILEDVLPYLGYEPQYTEEELKNFAIKVPNLIDSSVSDAKNEISKLGLKLRIIGSGDTIKTQLPAHGESLYKDGTVIVYTEDGGAGESTVSVPNFNGMTPAEANNTASSNGLNIKYSGNISSGTRITKAYDQDIAYGTEVAVGTTITVYFRDESSTD